jgi:hypothetical protein
LEGNAMSTQLNAAIAGILVLSTAWTTEGRCQSGAYARGGFEVAQIHFPRSQFPLSSANYPSVAFGHVFRGSQAIEARLNRIDARSTEPGREAYTIEVRATAVELGYLYRQELRGPVEARAGVGLLWIPTTYTWQSDTPAETARASLFGVSPSAGVALRLPGSFRLVGRAAYQLAHEERSPVRVRLNGFRLEGGLEFGR